jgi:hypothetical protein
MRPYLKEFGSFLAFLYLTNCCFGQVDTVRYSSTFRFPVDSATKSIILRDLNHFLNLYTKGSLPAPDLMTMPLTDELNGIQVNTVLKDPFFYKGFLDNMVALADSSYIIQLSYLGLVDRTPTLRANFELGAKLSGQNFTFFSPLLKNIRNWKTEKMGNITFIFQDSLDRSKASGYEKLDSFYNTKINALGQQTIFIIADNFPNALQLIGVNFKMDYEGYSYNSLSDFSNNKRVVISGKMSNGFPNYDPHDTWHEKLRTVMPDSVINRPVDEGCAYLFGGSWGYSWNEVLDSFMLYVRKHPDADWLSLYKNGDKFRMGKYQNAIANILNAFLVKKIQQEKGFSAVMELLSCGPREKGDANYFAALQKITGITQTGFNKEMNGLLTKQH